MEGFFGYSLGLSQSLLIEPVYEAETVRLNPPL